MTRHAPSGTSLIAALSVRSAFDALLTTLALPRGSKVVFSAINIEAMSSIAKAHGVVIQPVDIELSDLLPRADLLDSALQGARLFVLAHLYGTRGDTANLAAVCRKHDVPFVEDCSQAFDGRLRASDADIALCSFGPIKLSTSLGGGVALFKDAALAQSVAQTITNYRQIPDLWFRRRLLKYFFLKAAGHPLLFTPLFWCIRIAVKNPDLVLDSLAKNYLGNDFMGWLRQRPPLRLLRLLARRLDLADINRGRIDRAQKMTSGVAQLAPSPGANAARHTWWLTPILVDDPEAVLKSPREIGFDATRGATSLCALSTPEFPTPNAEYLLRHVLYLPNSAHLSARAIERLIERIRAVVSRRLTERPAN